MKKFRAPEPYFIHENPNLSLHPDHRKYLAKRGIQVGGKNGPFSLSIHDMKIRLSKKEFGEADSALAIPDATSPGDGEIVMFPDVKTITFELLRRRTEREEKK